MKTKSVLKLLMFNNPCVPILLLINLQSHFCTENNSPWYEQKVSLIRLKGIHCFVLQELRTIPVKLGTSEGFLN